MLVFSNENITLYETMKGRFNFLLTWYLKNLILLAKASSEVKVDKQEWTSMNNFLGSHLGTNYRSTRS